MRTHNSKALVTWAKRSLMVFGIAFMGSAHAAVLDLTNGGTIGGNQGSQIILPEATIDLIDGDFLTVGDFVANAVCSITSSLGCVGEFSLTWNFDVNNVVFDFGFADPGDSAVVSVFNASDSFLGSVNLSLTAGTSTQALLGFSDLRKIEFDTTASTGGGYAFGNINFDRAEAAGVPSPSVLALIGLGLAGLGWRRRKTV